MKHEWKQTIFKPEDFEGAGQYIVREGTNKLNSPHIQDTSYLSTVMMKVGYLSKYREGSSSSKYVLVDMSDGLITEGYFTNTRNEDGSGKAIYHWIWNDFGAESSNESKQNLCTFLNSNYYKETYRFATNEELIRVAAYQKYRTI